MANRVIVTGATGNLGKEVVAALMQKGMEVKAATTRPQAYPAQGMGQAVKFDYRYTSTWDDTLAGADGLFLIALPMDPEAPSKLNPFIDRAKEAGVRHIVMNSALGVDQNEEAPLRIIERHLMESGVDYTVLRPNFFMENFSNGFAQLPIKEQGGIFLAAGDGKTSFISTRDIARVAAAAFQDRMFGRELNLTGPEALDHYQVAEIISKVAGKPIQYHALSEDQMLEGGRAAGMPEGAVQYMGVLYGVVRAGWAEGITQDVEEVTGDQPMSFQAFAKQNAATWV